MIAHSRYLAVATAAAMLCGCSSKSDKSESAAPAAPAATSATPAPASAPAVFKVKFETSKGEFVVQVNKEWAPAGADRFYQLVQSNFFDNARFFRVISGFMAQFGISPDPKVAALWQTQTIPDDPPKQSNTKGRITFATAGPNTRTTQLFINLVDNVRLDASGFSPFGEVISGMDVVQSLYSGYGEGAPGGNGPAQDLIQTQGNAYLEKDFPRLDFIKKTSIQ
jgi:peptidyl-prolyl cis-trans isomerase A (cyclophilin A)